MSYTLFNFFISSYALTLAMFDLWKRIDDLKLDKQICALMMVLVLVNPDRQCPFGIRDELNQMNDIQEQFIEGTRRSKQR